MFLKLAAAGRADYLVTDGCDQLALKDAFRIPILTPKELIAVLD